MEQNDISSRIVFADRGKVNVEKGVEFAPKFDQNGLIPALAMDHITHECGIPAHDHGTGGSRLLLPQPPGNLA